MTQVTPICCVPGLGGAVYTQLPALGCWYLEPQGFRTAGWPNQSHPCGAAGFSDCGAIRKASPTLHRERRDDPLDATPAFGSATSADGPPGHRKTPRCGQA
ncbi:MAG: hypothetical protein KKH04_13645 [Proteobacteria bacterium]|nr:hypothetical protein [Pseudomonadota bacterium]